MCFSVPAWRPHADMRHFWSVGLKHEIKYWFLVKVLWSQRELVGWHERILIKLSVPQGGLRIPSKNQGKRNLLAFLHRIFPNLNSTQWNVKNKQKKTCEQ